MTWGIQFVSFICWCVSWKKASKLLQGAGCAVGLNYANKRKYANNSKVEIWYKLDYFAYLKRHFDFEISRSQDKKDAESTKASSWTKAIKVHSAFLVFDLLQGEQAANIIRIQTQKAYKPSLFMNKCDVYNFSFAFSLVTDCLIILTSLTFVSTKITAENSW